MHLRKMYFLHILRESRTTFIKWLNENSDLKDSLTSVLIFADYYSISKKFGLTNDSDYRGFTVP